MTPQEERNKRFDEKFKCIQNDCDGAGCIPYPVDDGVCQFHAEYILPFKSFLQSEIDLALAQLINKEIERKKGMRKELPLIPQIEEFPEKYKDNIEVNPETISIAMNNVRAMNYIAMNYTGFYEHGYNKAIDEDIAHLTSLKELIK